MHIVGAAVGANRSMVQANSKHGSRAASKRKRTVGGRVLARNGRWRLHHLAAVLTFLTYTDFQYFDWLLFSFI